MPPKKNPPTRNPSDRLKLELAKRRKAFPNVPELIVQRYCFNPNLPKNCAEAESESHLRHIKYQPFEGRDSLGTMQGFEYLAQAKGHMDNQNSYDPKYVIRPNDYVKHNNKQQLIFRKVIRDFDGCWIHKHAKGKVSDAEVPDAKVSDGDMLKILKKIGKNLRYLCTEAKRPHGNLRKGIAITPELETLFYNMSLAKHETLYSDDIKDLHEFLKTIIPNLRDQSIQQEVKRWKKFLFDTCISVEKEFTLEEASEIHPPYLSPNHVRMIVNYPISWDLDEKLEFLEKMHGLCKLANLLTNDDFKNHLENCYPEWNDCFKALTKNGHTSGLNEVYQYGVGQGNYVDSSTGDVCVPTIVIFAHSSVKHYMERAQDYNILHKCENVTDSGHMNPYLTPGEILADLEKEFPNLIENIYQAYYKAVAKGYKHPRFGIKNILPQLDEGI